MTPSAVEGLAGIADMLYIKGKKWSKEAMLSIVLMVALGNWLALHLSFSVTD